MFWGHTFEQFLVSNEMFLCGFITHQKEVITAMAAVLTDTMATVVVVTGNVLL